MTEQANASMATPHRSRLAAFFTWAVVLAVATILAAKVSVRFDELIQWELLFWGLVVALVELLPVPARPGLQLSLSFPLLLSLAILYDPAVAGSIAFVASFDARELRGGLPLSVALFNRSQIAFSILAGSLVFQQFATIDSPAYVLVPTVVLATSTSYIINVLLVSEFMHLRSGDSVREVLRRLRVGALSQFLLNYLGLGLVGLIISRLYDAVGIWSVFAFLLPLVFARQMFFRSIALEEAHNELKDRQRVLRALSNRMAEERQDERMQIAGYLHDDLAQMLFRLSLQVEMAKKRLEQGDVTGVGRDLDNIAQAKQQTSDMIRALIRDLHRSPIGRRGLAEAISSFASDMTVSSGPRVVADVVEVSLPPPIQLLIYQIAREAAMNALKHAEASTISISLHETGDGVELRIIDDGRGFDPGAPPPDGHFGTVMMKERALVAGGTFAMESKPGQGATIRATFPSVWVEEGSLLEDGPEPPDPMKHPTPTESGMAMPVGGSSTSEQAKEGDRPKPAWPTGPEEEDAA